MAVHFYCLKSVPSFLPILCYNFLDAASDIENSIPDDSSLSVLCSYHIHWIYRLWLDNFWTIPWEGMLVYLRKSTFSPLSNCRRGWNIIVRRVRQFFSFFLVFGEEGAVFRSNSYTNFSPQMTWGLPQLVIILILWTIFHKIFFLWVGWTGYTKHCLQILMEVRKFGDYSLL